MTDNVDPAVADAVALVTKLHYDGLSGFNQLINQFPDAYAQPKALAYAVVLLKGALDTTVAEYNHRAGAEELAVAEMLQIAGHIAATGEVPGEDE